MLKLYYIDGWETKLCKAEIKARLKAITLEDSVFDGGKSNFQDVQYRERLLNTKFTLEEAENVFAICIIAGRRELMWTLLHGACLPG